MSHPTEATHATAEDATLVRLAQGGDRHAFSELYRRYVRVVHGILLARLPFSEAEDQAQEVFITAFHQLSKLREPAAFGGWLAAIARNRATDFHRSDMPEEELTEEAGATSSGDSAEAAEALAAIRMLPDTYRETLLLRLVEGLTGPEIAVRTGLTHGSVRVNLHRGMEMLRRALGKELPL
jgi:RNA polymerase sigma-70 factor (ECF subfamily)